MIESLSAFAAYNTGMCMHVMCNVHNACFSVANALSHHAYTHEFEFKKADSCESLSHLGLYYSKHNNLQFQLPYQYVHLRGTWIEGTAKNGQEPAQ